MGIEKASGKAYPDFLKERIFQPLGMSSTVVKTSGQQIKYEATGYKLENAKWIKEALDDPSQPFAAGAIVSTPADMAKWAIALGEGRLLKKASWDEIWTAAKLTDGKSTGYGYGWGIGKTGDVGFVSHGGGIAGFTSHIIRFPAEDLAVVVLVNDVSNVTQSLAFQIAGLYLPKFAAARAAANGPTAVIEDKDPETTKFLRGVFEKMITGDVDQNLFAPDLQKNLFPNGIAQLKGLASTQGPIKSFELVRSNDAGGNKARSYRVAFEKGLRLVLSFTVDAQGKIAGAQLRPAD